ncbi:MAG: EAL domain-containing protein [Pseudomonadota bacterium]
MIRPLLVALLILAAGLFAAKKTQTDQDKRLAGDVEAFASLFATKLEERLRSRLDVAELLKDAINSRTQDPIATFRALAPTLHARNEDIQALTWVSAAGIIRSVTPMEQNRAALDLDITARPVPARVLFEARESQSLRVTPPLELAQGGRGFVAYLPIFQGAELLGYVSVVFRTAPMVEGILSELKNDTVDIIIRDGGDPVWSRGATDAPPDLISEQTIAVGGRSWDLTMAPSAMDVAASGSFLDEFIFVLSVVLSGASAFAIREIRNNRLLLADREERFDLAMKGASDGLFDYNAQTGQTYYSPRWFKMIGYRPGELVPGLETFLSLLHPEDEPRLREARRKVAFSDDMIEEEFRMRHKEGGWVHILSRAAVVRDGDTVKRIVGTHVDITELRQQQKELEWAARTDELTGLRNRRDLPDDLVNLCDGLSDGERLAVFHLDLDMFKSINDMLGHEAGDHALRLVADRLRADPAKFDIIARVGGDEFILAKRSCAPNVALQKIAEKTISRISEPFHYHGELCSFGASVGIAYDRTAAKETVSDVISNADIALTAAKNLGRGRSMIFSDGMQKETVYAAALAMDIEDSLRRKDFVSHYQPQIHIETGVIVGLEALARWHHPAFGLLKASEFVPIAERSNLISNIDELLFRQACQVVRRLPEFGLSDATVSVNMSTRQLMDPDVTERFAETAREHGADLRRLRVEILETTLLSARTDHVANNIRRLADLGVKLDLDDFGTGHAAISSLLNFPIARVKLDRSLVSNIDEDPRRQAIVHAIIEMSNSLSVEILAEGIETEAEYWFVKESGCSVVQGYYHAAPVPVENLHTLLSWPRLLKTA